MTWKSSVPRSIPEATRRSWKGQTGQLDVLAVVAGDRGRARLTCSCRLLRRSGERHGWRARRGRRAGPAECLAPVGSTGMVRLSFAYSRRIAVSRWSWVTGRRPRAARNAAAMAALRIQPPGHGVAPGQASRGRRPAADRRAGQVQAPQRRPRPPVREGELDHEVHPPDEGGVDVLPQVGGQHGEALEPVQPLQQVGRLEVGVAVVRVGRPRCGCRTARRPRRGRARPGCARRRRRRRRGSSRSRRSTSRRCGRRRR